MNMEINVSNIDYNNLDKYNQNNIILIVDKIDKKVIKIISQLKIGGIKINDNNINSIVELLENISPNTKILAMPKKEEVKKVLEQRKTYQGFNKSILNEVKRQILLNVQEDDYVVDATVGNGHDTKFLAEHVPKGKVYGFDIQKEAIEKTYELTKNYSNVCLYQESHTKMSSFIRNQKVKLILFNLGYLPGGDKNITTKSKTTIEALEEALKIIRDDGLILVTVYPGHAEGKKEKREIFKWLNLNNISYIIKRNTLNKVAPFLIIIKN